MIQINLLNSCQSGFWPNDSCVNQHFSITHSIYPTFETNPSLKVLSVFLNLSKVFDKVWHEGLLYKNNGINGNALQLKESFLHNRRHRVVLNNQYSSWLFSILNCVNTLASTLYSDLLKIQDCA